MFVKSKNEAKFLNGSFKTSWLSRGTDGSRKLSASVAYLVACLTTDPLPLSSNLGVGIYEGRFVFDSAHLAYHMDKSGRKTPIIISSEFISQPRLHKPLLTRYQLITIKQLGEAFNSFKIVL